MNPRNATRFLLAITAIGFAAPSAFAQDRTPSPSSQASESMLAVMSPGETPPDERLGPLRTLDSHFPFHVPATAEAWHERAEQLRRTVKVATGLWPMPERTPLNPVIHGRVERDGFTFEKVYFESLPGHFVTGLLFRPSEPAPPGTRRPGVLCPHGHGGRMQRYGAEAMERERASGAEPFPSSGQTPALARCGQLARMGCVTFIFDMLGYADSIQIPFEVSHRHQHARPEEARPVAGQTPPSWVLYSIDAELRMQSVMGLQTWNAIRALDFLASLPDVDPERLGVTGSSGGGTQTILLGAIDPRVKVSFPNGMVSTSMQGGCYCENCNFLRVDTGNVELAGLMAPRPQAMTAADDWTRDMMTDGFPQLQQLYRLVGDEADVQCTPLLHFPHNFNYVSRSLMYPWMNRHLNIGLSEPIVEQPFETITDAEARVWNDEHPQPAVVGPDHEREVCAWLDQQARSAIDSLWPSEKADVASFRDTFRPVWRTLLSLDATDDSTIEFVPQSGAGASPSDSTDRAETQSPALASSSLTRGLLKNEARGAAIPLAVIEPASHRADQHVVIWCLPGGKATAIEPDTDAARLLTSLIGRGFTIILPDLFDQGELVAASDEPSQPRLVENGKHYAAYTFGYNRTLIAERVADLLDTVGYAETLGAKSVALIGCGETAPVALAAAAVADDGINRTAVLLDGFRFEHTDSYASPTFVPGSVKYGDVEMLMALAAPQPLWVRDREPTSDRVQQVYASLDATSNLAHAPMPAARSALPVDELLRFLEAAVNQP